jgi:hypothetical protein
MLCKLRRSIIDSHTGDLPMTIYHIREVGNMYEVYFIQCKNDCWTYSSGFGGEEFRKRAVDFFPLHLKK